MAGIETLEKISLRKYSLIYFVTLSYLFNFILIKVMILRLPILNFIAYHLVAWSPNISAIFVLGLIVKDRSGIHKLLEGWTKWRVNFTWYLVTLLPLAVGLIWAGWHIPYWPIPGWFPKMQSIPFLAFALQSIAKSVIMTWIYNNTRGSVFLASLFHLVLNYSLFLGVLPSSPLPIEPIIISTVTWLVFAVIIVIVFGSTKLSRKSYSEMPFGMTVNEN